MKKILIFSLNYYPKYVGGAEVAIKEIVERLPKGKYEFHMLTLRFDSDLPKEEIIHGIHVHRIGFTKKNPTMLELKNSWLKYNKYYFQIFSFVFAIKLHLKYKFDAIWAMMAHSAGVPAGIFKLQFPKVKYILTLQEGDPPEHIERLAKPLFWPISSISFWLFKNGFKKADIVQSISTFLNDWAVRMGNKKFKVVIPNAVDIKQFTRPIAESEVSEIRNTIGKKEGEVWLATTSRLVHKNGIDDVVNAIAILPSKYHFLIMGIGPDEDKLKALVKKLNLEDRVHMVGEIKHPLMAVYLKACDIFIRPSRSEGMGNSFVEAMSLKMPVISTTEGGLADFIFDGETAWVVKKDSPEGIKNSVSDIENSNNKEVVIDKAYKMVVEKFDWDLIAKRMEKEVFEKI